MSDATQSLDTDEAQRRVLINLVKALMEELWKSRPEPIMILWDGFCRNLDDGFLPRGAPVSSYVLPRFALNNYSLHDKRRVKYFQYLVEQ